MDFAAKCRNENGDKAIPTTQNMQNEGTCVPASTSLEAEWASFEMMIGGSEAPMPVSAPKAPATNEASVHSNPLFGYDSGSKTSIDVCDLSKHCEPSTAHLTGLSSEYNPEIVDEDSSDEETVLKGVVSPDHYDPHAADDAHSSPGHSSRGSSSSSSRSSSVDSAKEKSPPPSTSKKEDEHSSRKVARRDRSRSPHRKRRRSSDRKHSRSRSRSRRSSDRSHTSRSHGKRGYHKSSSHSSHRRRRSPRHTSRERRSSRDRHARKGHSYRRRHSKDRHQRRHSRSRSRSPSREKMSRGKGMHASNTLSNRGQDKIVTFKDRMRQQLLTASKLMTAGQAGKETSKEKVTGFPLSAAHVFQAITAAGNVTPQMALLQTMAAMQQKAQELTGVAVPKYYNPAAVNPLKYAEQVQKRKLLWSKNKEQPVQEEVAGSHNPCAGSHNQWQATSFVQDQDGKMAAKFRKLMGMKEGEEEDDETQESEDKKKQTEELFYRLDKEYEFARMTTHTHRGIGLGFQSQGFPNP